MVSLESENAGEKGERAGAKSVGSGVEVALGRWCVHSHTTRKVLRHSPIRQPLIGHRAEHRRTSYACDSLCDAPDFEMAHCEVWRLLRPRRTGGGMHMATSNKAVKHRRRKKTNSKISKGELYSRQDKLINLLISGVLSAYLRKGNCSSAHGDTTACHIPIERNAMEKICQASIRPSSCAFE